jgi:hypothetical protein
MQKKSVTDTQLEVAIEVWKLVRREWCAQGDDFRTFLANFVAALPQIEFLAGLNL